MLNFTCRRCTECAGHKHHWIDNPAHGIEQHPLGGFTHRCKHCDTVGNECSMCDGDGEEPEDEESFCAGCLGEGVIAVKPGSLTFVDQLEELAFLWGEDFASDETAYLWVNRERAVGGQDAIWQCDVQYWPQIDRFFLVNEKSFYELPPMSSIAMVTRLLVAINIRTEVPS